MAYKVYRRDKGSESVELVNDKVYETKEEAEAAMFEAEEKHYDSIQPIPLPTDVLGPGSTNIPADEIVKGEELEKEKKVEFFIREA